MAEQKRKRRRFALWGLAGLAAAALVYAALRPSPVSVDIGQARRGPMSVTIDEEGRTRVKEVYLVSAPITGQLLRIRLHAGDEVEVGETVIARIVPADPDFLDVRTKAQAEASVRAAEAALALAEAELARVRAELDYARSEEVRVSRLAARGTASRAQLERAQLQLKSQKAALETAGANVRVKASQLETAKALLVPPQSSAAQSNAFGAATLPVIAPVGGRVLRVLTESEVVVAAGTALVEIGDPRDLEIVVDVLSSDAVKIEPGDAVEIVAWGGEGALDGEVRRIEPFGFTKISALGVEEQRVNVIVDLTSRPELWQALGHGFRVEARIEIWTKADALQVPLAALFRQGEEWNVFCVKGGSVRLCPVKIGQLNDETAYVIDGLKEGDEVVLYPSDEVRAGRRIVPRAVE